MLDKTIGEVGSRPGRKAALSLVLGSRNDQYMGNSRWRLQTALNYVAKQVDDLGRCGDVEVIVTDWGSDIPLQNALRLSPAAAKIVSFLAVPPELARELQKDSPFPEVLTVNAAARRANGQYIGRIDQDTLVGKRFLETFFDLHEGRRKLPVALPSALMFANQRMVPYRFAVRCPPFWAVDRYIGSFGRSLKIELTPLRAFYAHGVGLWLIHRDLWDECGGYDERMIYPNEQEINMIARLIKRYEMVDLGKLVDYDFYHVEHYHSLEPRRSARYRKVNPRMPFSKPDRLNPNGTDWGLLRQPLKVLPYSGKIEKAADAKPPFAPPRYLFLLALVRTQIACDKLILLPLVTAYALWVLRAGIAWKAVRGESPLSVARLAHDDVAAEKSAGKPAKCPAGRRIAGSWPAISAAVRGAGQISAGPRLPPAQACGTTAIPGSSRRNTGTCSRRARTRKAPRRKRY